MDNTIDGAQIIAALKQGKGNHGRVGYRPSRDNRALGLRGRRMRDYMHLQARVAVDAKARLGHDCDMQSMGVPEYYTMDPREAGQYLTGERW